MLERNYGRLGSELSTEPSTKVVIKKVSGFTHEMKLDKESVLFQKNVKLS